MRFLLSKQQFFLLVFGFLVLALTLAGVFSDNEKFVLPTITSDDFATSSEQMFFVADKGFEVRLVRVVDGDTLIVIKDEKEIRVRLIGINAPESVDPRRPVECFGKEAGAHLKEIIGDQVNLRLELDLSQGTYDKYGRLLAYVFTNKVLLNRRMIADGYAYEYTYRLPYLYQADFKQAELMARETLVGLWSSEACGQIKK